VKEMFEKSIVEHISATNSLLSPSEQKSIKFANIAMAGKKQLTLKKSSRNVEAHMRTFISLVSAMI
jgi:hypothetical protein